MYLSVAEIHGFRLDMRQLIISAIFVVTFTGVAASQAFRHFDFKNFSYPWGGPPHWSDRLEWLSPTVRKTGRLTDGRWTEPHDDREAEDQAKINLPFNRLTLESVTWGDVTGQGQDDPIVVIRYDSGGTQFSYFV